MVSVLYKIIAKEKLQSMEVNLPDGKFKNLQVVNNVFINSSCNMAASKKRHINWESSALIHNDRDS